LEYDTAMKAVNDYFEPRADKEGEGNADPSLHDEICEAEKEVANHYLHLMAENNEARFAAIVQANKDFLNDYLYWVRRSSLTKEIYQAEYYDIMLSMLRILDEVRLAKIENYCHDNEEEKSSREEVEEKEPKCPLPVGIEIPLIIGKITLDCEAWGVEFGEGIIVNIEHKFGGGTTIAFGPGLIFHETHKIKAAEEIGLAPGIETNAKMQFFITFDGSTAQDAGFLWEAEIDAKGLGKPLEAKQNFSFAINKGFNYEGILTDIMDKVLEVEPEKQVNKNIKIYKGSNQ